MWTEAKVAKLVQGGDPGHGVLGYASDQQPCNDYGPTIAITEGRLLFYRQGLTLSGVTPRVRDGNYFHVNNATPTTITNFIDGLDGQIVYLVFDNANTTVAHNNDIRLAEISNFTPGIEDTLTLLKVGNMWFELARRPSRYSQFTLDPTTFAALGTPTTAVMKYCSDCTRTDPCAGAGTGAYAFREGNAWRCNAIP